MRYESLNALVIHVRPYRESSVIAQFLTREQGMLRVVMRGVKGSKKPSPVQTFACGKLSCFGRGSLLTGKQFEAQQTFVLTGNYLSAGFYVLEVTNRLLSAQQAEPEIFDISIDVLMKLQHGEDIVTALRPYEIRLLSLLGYGIDYLHEADSGEPVDAQARYEFVLDAGFVRSSTASTGEQFDGAALLAIAAGRFDDAAARHAAGIVNRRCLAPLLGSKPLISRQLWEPGHTSAEAQRR